MHLKDVLNIARCLNGIEVEKYEQGGMLNLSALLMDLPKYKRQELALYAPRIEEYNEELTSLKSNKPAKPSNEPPITMFQMLLSMWTEIKQMGLDADNMRLLDAKTILEQKGKQNLISNLHSVRDQLKKGDKVNFDVDYEELIKSDYDIDIYKRIRDHYITAIRGE